MRNLLLITFLLFLTGCASQGMYENGAPLGSHKLPWPKRQAQLSAIRQWNAQGSIGARSARNGWNASFSWQQQPSDYTIQLFGPLGVNRVQLTGNSQQVILQTADNKAYTANTPETLIRQQLGWQLPVSNLYYWLRGLPAPSARYSRSLDANNHLVHLVQDGWTLQYLRYVSVNGVDLPDRISLSNARWQVRLVITNWQLQ